MKRSYDKTGSMVKGLFKRKKYAKSSKATVSQIVQREIMRTSELKENPSVAVNQSSTTSGTVVVLNFIAEGDDSNNRQGRKINTRAIDVKYSYIEGTANGTAQVALVYDATPSAVVPSYGTIFDTSTANAGMAFKDTQDNRQRFKIFWIDELPISNGSDSTNGFVHRTRHYLNLSKYPNYQKVGYGSTAGSTPNSGGWYLCYGDSLNTTTLAKINYNVKYQYTDA